MNKTAVIILHYKGEKDTYECLNSLLPEYSINDVFKIIVVCNAPAKDFCSRLRRAYSKIEVIENRDNIGFAEGNNMGIKKALEYGCEYIILLNNDTLVGPKLVAKLTSFVKSDTIIGLVSPKIYFASGCEYHRDAYSRKDRGRVIWYAGGILDWSNIYASHRGVDEVDKGQYNNIVDTDFATGCAMLIKRQVVEKVGFLDKRFFLYFEDIDYSIRAKRVGFRVVYYPDAFLWHKNASASDKPGSPIHVYFQTRNRLYFGYKYASWRTKKSLVVDSLRLWFKGGVYMRAVSDYYSGKMGKGLL